MLKNSFYLLLFLFCSFKPSYELAYVPNCMQLFDSNTILLGKVVAIEDEGYTIKLEKTIYSVFGTIYRKEELIKVFCPIPKNIPAYKRGRFSYPEVGSILIFTLNYEKDKSRFTPYMNGFKINKNSNTKKEEITFSDREKQLTVTPSEAIKSIKLFKNNYSQYNLNSKWGCDYNDYKKYPSQKLYTLLSKHMNNWLHK